MQKTDHSVILKIFARRVWQFVLISLLFSETINAQSDYSWEPVSRSYTTKDGLPSMETYCSIQDSKGYLWVGTDNGVARFNGNKFKSYSINEGLGSNTIYEIREDFKGRIWFFSNRPEIYFFENGEIKAFEHNQAIREYVGDFFEYSTVKITKEGIQLSTSKRGSFIVRFNGEIKTLANNHLNKKKDLFLLVEVDKSGEKYSARTPYVNDHLTYKVALSIFDSMYFESFVVLDNIFSGWIEGSFYYWATEKRVWLVHDNTSKVIDFDKEITAIFKYREELWIALKNGGVVRYKYYNDRFEVKKDNLIEGYTVTSGNVTSDGSLWLTTLEKGLIQIQNSNISTLNIRDLQRGAWSTAGLSKGYLTGVSREIAYSINLDSRDKLSEITDAQSVVSIPDNRFAIVSTRKILSNNLKVVPAYVKLANGKIERLDYPYTWERYSILELNGDYLYGNRYGVCFSDVARKPIKVDAGVRTFAAVSDSIIWISNFLWTSKLNIYSGELIEPKYEKLKQRSTDIFRDSDGDFLFATPGDGIWRLSDTIEHYNVHNGLPENNVKELIHFKGDKYWLVCGSSISLVELGGNDAKIILTYSVFDLDCEKIEDVSYQNGELYVATNNGLKRIVINNINSKALSIPLSYFGFYLGENNVSLSDNYQLNYYENHIKIDYDVISFSGKTVQFRYRLQDDEKWVSTFDRTINFIQLPPGYYHFELQSSLDGKNWISSKQLNFSILAPFWTSWWFIAIIVVVFLLVVTLIVRKIILRVLERNAKIKRLSELKQVALSQQLNPHFVFNAMGSLQNSILKGNIEKANQYIVGFSKFLRSGLDASRAELISISDEIELMKRYLNLERSRIGDGFFFEVVYQGKADPNEIMIPPFVAQPFIENAIKHGIATKPDGEVTIVYKVEGNSLYCSVRDNGAGLGNSYVKSKSYGTRIAFERIDLINKLYGGISNDSIENVVDENGVIKGVIVQFNLPIIKKNVKGNNS